MKIGHVIGVAFFFLFFIGCEKQYTEYSIEEFMNTLSVRGSSSVSYTHLRAHETEADLV